MVRTNDTTAVRVASVTIAIVCAWGLWMAPASAAVDLVLAPHTQTVGNGAMVEIGLYAVSDSEEDQSVAAMDVVLVWDPAILELTGFTNNGPYSWLMSGFLGDSQLDGVNDSLLDGDAIYTALSGFNTPALATPEGLLVTTLQFTAVAESASTTVAVEAALGDFSVTRVFGGNGTTMDVTGDLGEATITILGAATLSVFDVSLLAGRASEVLVSGEIVDRLTFGLTIVVGLVPRAGNTGTVSFTEAPPSDIIEVGDPWPFVGTFTPFDTDQSGAVTLNGMVDDNGTFLPASVTFSGPLAAFPVIASEDAQGVWDIVLSVPGSNSSWEGLATTLRAGNLRIVAPGDRNGDGAIDILDFSGLQECFSGPRGPVEPPAYPRAAQLHCGVYDFDGDGDVDGDDYASFRATISGPGS